MAELRVKAGQNWVSTDQLARYMREQRLQRLSVPGLLMPEEMLEYQRVRNAEFCLVRNRGGVTGERSRCSTPHLHQCNGYHEFFTYMGVDRPFRGLDRALWGYAQISRDTALHKKLLAWAPHLDAGHPALAKTLAPKEPGTDLIAIAIGVLEPITSDHARALIEEINKRRPPIPLRL